MAAAEVDGHISDRRDSLAEFKRLEKDIRLETSFCSSENGFNSGDEQSIPSAPPSSAGLDGCEGGTNDSNGREMFGRPSSRTGNWEYSHQNGVSHGGEPNGFKPENVEDGKSSFDMHQSAEEPPPAPVKDTDSSSTRTILGSPQRLPGKTRALKPMRPSHIKRAESLADNDDGGQKKSFDGGGGDAIGVENVVLSSTLDEEDGIKNDIAAGDAENDDAVEADGEYIDDGEPTPPTAEVADDIPAQQNQVPGVFNFQKQTIAHGHNFQPPQSHPTSFAKKMEDHTDEEDETEDDGADDEVRSQKTLKKQTQDILMKKKADAAAREWEATGKKTKTKVCSII